MGRRKREYPINTVIHVTQKVINNEFRFDDPYFKEYYCLLLERATKKFKVSILNYTIMNNHIHLLVVQQKEGQISLMLNMANGSIARAFNFITKRTGPFWNQRSAWTRVKDVRHLVEAMLYIDFNPIRVQEVIDPREYHYSGTKELIGKRPFRLVDKQMVNKLLSLRGDFSENYSKFIDEKMKIRNQPTPIWKVEVD